MSSLRRDLIERRLWPFAIILVAAIVAVPFLLHGHGGARAVTSPPAANGSPAPASGTTRPTHATTHHQATPTSHKRDPFSVASVQGASAESATTSTTTSSTSTSSPSSSTSSSTAATVSSGGAASSAGSGAPTSSTSTSTPANTTPVTTTPVTPTVTTAPETGTSKPTHWTVYSIDVRAGALGSPTARRNIAAFTPLPGERAPQAMFMGTTDHARAAVFALRAGVEVSGMSGKRSSGVICRPSLADCTLIAMPVGKSVRLSYVSSNGDQRGFALRLTRISARVITSASAARAAQGRRSAVGLCDLELGDPLGFYNPGSGQMKLPSAKACRRNHKAVAFPGSLGAGSSERG
jgi:hypothetical protein